MTPTHDQVTRLLGAVKDVHQLAWDAIENMTPEEKFTLDSAKQAWEQTEAELAAESEGVTSSQDGDGFDPGSCWTCSGCGDERYWEDDGPEKHGVKFCVNCGAKVKSFEPYVAPETEEL